MTTNTTAVFILGSGRSGTRQMFKLLSGELGLEVYHEYLCTHIQQAAALYFMGRLSRADLQDEFMRLHGAAIHYSSAKYWIDCSNKLSWIIEPISELLPQSKFVLITRDGRKVVSSFFHKLADEIYDDLSVNVLQDWLNKTQQGPRPPPEKRYWWNIPQVNQPYAEEFRSFNQFQRICYHWTEVHRVVLESFEHLPSDRWLVFKLEELTASKAALARFLEFVGVGFREDHLETLKTPQGVIFPMDFKLSPQQVQQFWHIAGSMMERLGYSASDEYSMKY